MTIAAIAVERVEEHMVGCAWLEALGLAILIGTAVRTTWTPSARSHARIAFSAKTLLEMRSWRSDYE